MDRRTFLRNCALIAAGVVAADQLEILERLAHRKVFASPFPNSRVGHIELLDRNGFVARRVPWNGERLSTLPYDDANWARLVVAEPHAPESMAALLRVGVVPGGERYTVPWRRAW